MIHEYNQDLIIVTKPNMVTFNDIQKDYPQVKVVIQNFADEHQVPLTIIETIAAIVSDKPLWVHFNVDREYLFQKVMIYSCGNDYELIEEFSVPIDTIITQDAQSTIVKRLKLRQFCELCIYYSGNSVLNCAVNPMLIIDDNDQCSHYIE
jgi:hypothetical protein